MSTEHRTLTVIYEGADVDGEHFYYRRTVRTDKSGDNPRFYAEQLAEAGAQAVEGVRLSVEGRYGQAPD